MPELDAVIAGVAGLITGASPAVLHAIWRYCNKRSDQRHERYLRELEIKEQAVKRGIERQYDVIDSEADGFFLRLTHQDDEQREGSTD